MEVKQIANILNTVINSEQLGESAVVNEDLSNIVDVGKQLNSSSTFDNNFDNFTKALIDRIGLTLFDTKKYKGFAPNIMRTGWEYGSALQKVRCDLPDAENNASWTLADLSNGSTVDPFIISKPSIKAKYFNKKTTFDIPITLSQEAVKEAFLSAENMNNFFSMIENRVAFKMELCTDAMSMRTINNLIANKINSKKNVINLLADYNTKTGKTLKADNCLSDSEFLRYAAKEIMLYKKYIQNASVLYNNDGYVTFTPPDSLQLVMLTDVAKGFEVDLYSNTYNDEFIKITNYSDVPYWQGSGTNNSFAEHSTLNITAVDTDGKEFTVNQSGIIGTMFDQNAAMICNTNFRTTSIYNPKAEYWNYFYKFDCMYLNDLAENCIVFIVADATE